MIRPYTFGPPPPPCGTYGHCHAYAIAEVVAWYEDGCPDPAPVLCLGRSVYLEEYRNRCEHSWIERGGFSYDWQRVVLRGLDPIASEKFNRLRRPDGVARYAHHQVGWTMWKRGTPPVPMSVEEPIPGSPILQPAFMWDSQTQRGARPR